MSWNKGHPPSGFSLSHSSPCGDVSWNSIIMDQYFYIPVRLPKETRVEILWHITPDNKNPFVSARRRELKSKMTVEEEACIMIRLLSLRRRELKYYLITRTWQFEQFVSVRRRELKWWYQMEYNRWIQVRLLAETWVEITEVIWIKKLLYVRLLAETWIEIVADRDNSANAAFVSLRRRELK